MLHRIAFWQRSLALAGSLALGGCQGNLGGEHKEATEVGAPGGGGGSVVPDAVGVTKTDPCFSPQQSFAWELYGPVFQRCIGCHNEFGLARQVGVGYRLRYPGDANFAEHNVELLSGYASVDVETDAGALPILLAKPTGRVDHLGGQVLAPDGPEARLLASFVDKLRNPPACSEDVEDQAEVVLGSLTVSSPKQTYARAKLVLAGEVATPEELDQLEDTEEMLSLKLDEFMATEAFLTRAQEMYGDWLRTDSYSSLVRGDELLGMLRDFPRREYFLRLCTEEITNNCCDTADGPCCATGLEDATACTDVANTLAIDAVAREPLELVKYIVANDLPLTELVTANYGMVNPYSAIIYGLSEAQRADIFDADASNDAAEFRAVPLVPSPDNSMSAGPDGAYPHAGVLTMPSTLVRYPSSDSNLQRTRGARVVLERMLAIPVMKLADFSVATLPPDADLELATQEYPACTVCHSAIDPIAAHFRNFGATGEYRPGGQGLGRRFQQEAQAHLPDAEFLGTVQPEGEPADASQWLGSQVAQHERFALGVLMPVLADLIGAEILTPPNDVLAEDYHAKYLAFRIQQIEIQRLRRQLAGPSALRLRPLVKAIVTGPFFRAAGAPEYGEVTSQAMALAGIGPGTLLTPETLARKIESATGITYRSGRDPNGRDMLRSFRDYRLMFGGTDWDSTPERYREPNAMAVRIALRMGNEVACVAVPQDLSFVDLQSRKLFRNVDVSTTPDAGEAQIRAEIRRLHRLVLGEDVSDGDVELEATYKLWVDSFQALSAASTSGGGRGFGGGGFSVADCGATTSYTADATPYPTDTHQVVEGAEPTVGAWITVLSYMLGDGRFFLQ
jgi:hypothetical protein